MRRFWSAHTRVLSGSAALAAAAAGLGGACAAQPQGDGLSQPAAYHGPFLTWAGKTGGTGAASPAQPMADASRSAAEPGYAAQHPYAPPPPAAAEFASWPAPAPASAPRPRPVAPAPYAEQDRYAAPEQPAAPARYAAPQRYAAATPTYTPTLPPATAYVAPPPPRPTPAAAAPYVAPPEQVARRRPPTAQAAAPTPPAAAATPHPAAQALAQNDTGPAVSPTLQPTGVHYYSLHREYGLTPDAVETPKDRPMVLIGPPDNPPTQRQDSADDNGGSARHGDGEGADQ